MIYIYRYTDKIFIFLHNVSFLLQQLTGIKFIPLEARKYPPIEFRLLFHDD